MTWVWSIAGALGLLVYAYLVCFFAARGWFRGRLTAVYEFYKGRKLLQEKRNARP